MGKYEDELQDFLGEAEEKDPQTQVEPEGDAFGEEKPAPKPRGKAKAKAADKDIAPSIESANPASPVQGKAKYMPPPADATKRGSHRLPSGNVVTNA